MSKHTGQWHPHLIELKASWATPPASRKASLCTDSLRLTTSASVAATAARKGMVPNINRDSSHEADMPTPIPSKGEARLS
eukprot:scaffold1448_cov387-Prasinococcus_capsulatus_cf.AAC.6